MFAQKQIFHFDFSLWMFSSSRLCVLHQLSVSVMGRQNRRYWHAQKHSGRCGTRTCGTGGQDSKSRCVKMRNHQILIDNSNAKLTRSEVPMISKVQKSVDVPQIEYEDKVVEVPIQKPVPLAAENFHQIWVSQVRYWRELGIMFFRTQKGDSLEWKPS